MTLNEYQEAAMKTAHFHEKNKIIYPALKLSGEAGEVTEKIGKMIRDTGWEPGHAISQPQAEALMKELGDVLWYIAAFANGLDVTLEDIAQMNIAKLADREARGVIKGSGDNR